MALVILQMTGQEAIASQQEKSLANVPCPPHKGPSYISPPHTTAYAEGYDRPLQLGERPRAEPQVLVM